MSSQLSVKPYHAIRAHGQDLLRQNVVEAAGQVLEEEGPESVTVRKIAQKLECSTKIVYSLFGSKDGLANELYQEGCRRLKESFAQAEQDSDPVGYLLNLGWAYWEFAQNNPNYYRLMFNGAVAEFKPDDTSLACTTEALELLTGSLQKYIQRGVIRENDPVMVSHIFWSALHGVINLYFGHQYKSVEEASEIYKATLKTLLLAMFRQKQGDSFLGLRNPWFSA